MQKTSDTKIDYDKLTNIAKQQCLVGVRFKQPRLAEIQKSEDLYFGKVKKALKGRFNVPLPIMSGYIDTLVSKIDDAPTIKFKHQKEENLKVALKTTAMWEFDSSPTNGKWARKDRGAKKLAAFSGRAIYKYMAESDPVYKSVLEIVDHNDFVCEPQGGSDLDTHLFLGQMNIFRTKAQLESNDNYNKEQVAKLITNTSDETKRASGDLYQNKISRFSALGLDVTTNSFVGQSVYALTEWYMVYEGTWYYLLFDPVTGIWVRACPLVEVFESNMHPYVSWATHEDPFNFWSKAPADDIRPVAEAMGIVFNQALDNRSKQNYGQRAFDPAIFPDASQLEWRPGGLVVADTNGGARAISSGIYEFKTPEIGGTIDLFTYLDNFLGQKTGITSSAQGVSDANTKVGIYYGDLKQVADRLGLYNKSYNEAWAELGIRYVHGLKEHLSEAQAVRIVGSTGIEWDELTKDDVLDPEFDIQVLGGDIESQIDEVKKKSRSAALETIIKVPTLTESVSPAWLVEEILRNGGFDDVEIKAARDVKNQGNQEILSEAAQAIEDILKGKTPKKNRGANTAFIQKIVDFATDEELEKKTFDALMAYANSHFDIVIENMARKAYAEKGVADKQPPPVPSENGIEQPPGMQAGGPPQPPAPPPIPGAAMGNPAMSQPL